MKVIVVKTDNSIEVKELEGNVMAQIKEIVEGYPEPIYSRAANEQKLMLSKTCLACAENKYGNGKKINLLATILHNGKLSPFMHPILGNVLIIGEGTEDHRGLRDDEINHYLNVLAAMKQASLNFLDSVR